MKKNNAILVVLLMFLTGCSTDSGWKVAYEQERASRQEQDARLKNLETQQRQGTQQQAPAPQQPPARQSAQRKVTMAEIAEKCRTLQYDRKVPITCSTGVYEGTPYIEFGFYNFESMQQYWDTLVKIFVDDFCGRHNDAGNKAMVMAKLAKPDPGAIRGATCFTNYMSEWKLLKKTTPASDGRY